MARVVIPGFRKIETGGDTGGTSNYNDLTDKPSINGVTLHKGMIGEDLHLTINEIGGTENLVEDPAYTHTDNNFTNEQVEQISELYSGADTTDTWSNFINYADRLLNPIQMSVNSLPWQTDILSMTSDALFVRVDSSLTLKRFNIIDLLSIVSSNREIGRTLLNILNNSVATLEIPEGADGGTFLVMATILKDDRDYISLISIDGRLPIGVSQADWDILVDTTKLPQGTTLTFQLQPELPITVMNTTVIN